MKPTPEIERAAMEFCPDELEHRFHTDKHACIKVAKLIAQERANALADEAQHWENLLRPGQEVPGSEIKARLWMVADNARAAALANLGAEEKPRILLVEDATMPPGEAELRGSKDTIRIKNIGDAKPEPKCGECSGSGIKSGVVQVVGEIFSGPCPSCSGGKP